MSRFASAIGRINQGVFKLLANATAQWRGESFDVVLDKGESIEDFNLEGQSGFKRMMIVENYVARIPEGIFKGIYENETILIDGEKFIIRQIVADSDGYSRSLFMEREK